MQPNARLSAGAVARDEEASRSSATRTLAGPRRGSLRRR
jgi:hypothetical protein